MTRRGWRSTLTAVAVSLAAAQPLAADTLEELMDGCLQVMIEADYTGVSAYGVKRMEENTWGAIRRVDGREVSLLVQLRQDDTIHSCSVVGSTFGDDSTIAAPGLSWAQGAARGFAWLDAMVNAPGRAEVPAYGPPSRTVSVCPDPAREGFMVTIIPATFGSKTTGMPEADRPFLFNASRVARPKQACDFVQRFGKG